MNVGFYATRVQAAVLNARDSMENAYQEFPDATLFWCFVDLVGSSNFRIAHGPKEGYARGLTFFTLVREVIAPCVEVRLIKEIGDAVLICAPSVRPLLETCFLLDLAASQIANLAGSEHFPFAMRAAIGYGPAKRLLTPAEDFIGTPIDQLARVMAVRSPSTNILAHVAAYDNQQTIFAEYSKFCTVSSPKAISSETSKQMLSQVYYRELLVDRKALAVFRDHFSPWRNWKEVDRQAVQPRTSPVPPDSR